MALLTAEAVAETHPYLATAHPHWTRSMQSIQRDGGPWPCRVCDGGSLLVYRCSQCGADLASSRGTYGRTQ